MYEGMVMLPYFTVHTIFEFYCISKLYFTIFLTSIPKQFRKIRN